MLIMITAYFTAMVGSNSPQVLMLMIVWCGQTESSLNIGGKMLMNYCFLYRTLLKTNNNSDTHHKNKNNLNF